MTLFEEKILADKPTLFVPMNEGPYNFAVVHQTGKGKVIMDSTTHQEYNWSFKGGQAFQVKDDWWHDRSKPQTWGVWFKSRVVDKRMFLFTRLGNTPEYTAATLAIGPANGKIELLIYHYPVLGLGGSETSQDFTPYMDGQWHYLVYRVSGSAVEVFVDAQKWGQVTNIYALNGISDPAPLVVGMLDAPERGRFGFYGEMAGFEYHRGVSLSDAKIKSHYDIGVKYLRGDTVLFEDGVERKVIVDGIVTESGLAPLSVSGVVKPSPSRFYDNTELLKVIDTTTTWPFSSEPGRQLAMDYLGYDITCHEQAGSITDSAYADDMDHADPESRETYRMVAEEFTKYPPVFLRGHLYTLKRFALATNVHHIHEPERDLGGMSVLPPHGWIYIDTHNKSPNIVRVFGSHYNFKAETFHHEILHHFHYADKPFFDGLEAEWTAKNTIPYQGMNYLKLPPGRPEGFTRHYGAYDYMEDLADVFGYLMTTGLQGQFNQFVAEDPIFAWKAQTLKDWMASKHDAFRQWDYFDAIHRA